MILDNFVFAVIMKGYQKGFWVNYETIRYIKIADQVTVRLFIRDFTYGAAIPNYFHLSNYNSKS